MKGAGVDEKKKPTKSETLTLRLDPKTRFVLDLVARARGQTITTVLERAIYDAANQLTDYTGRSISWEKFWSVSDGARFLKVASARELFPTFEEERILKFANEHWSFFYTSSTKHNVYERYLDVLWPSITKYVETWERTRASDGYAAGRMMREDLLAAGVDPPEWPPEAPF
jgi:predicted transcriptional regulator